MAGQPKKRAMILELEKRTREELDHDAATHLDYVEYWTEGGGTLVKLAAEINCDPQMISRYLEAEFGNEATRRLGAARVEGARRLAEQSIEVVDNAKDDSGAQSKARNQASGRQWLASKWNRAEFGEPKQGSALVINVGSLHLSALRHRSVNEAALPQPARAFVSTDGEPESSSAIADAIAEHVEVLTDGTDVG